MIEGIKCSNVNSKVRKIEIWTDPYKETTLENCIKYLKELVSGNALKSA